MVSSNATLNSRDSLIDSTSNRGLSTFETAHLKSPYYEVEDFGFLVLTSNEQYEDGWYPTPSDIVPGGWFTLEIDNAAFGDFNGDGLQDLVIHPMLFPHFKERETRVDPIFLLQQADGSFANPQETLENTSLPEKYMTYRMGVGDFNGDGIDDVTLSSMGAPVGTERFAKSESPLTVYGGREVLIGTDSYNNLPLAQGAPNWQIGYKTGHSMAVGDFNGDGLSDWYSDHYAAYSTGDGFVAEHVIPNSSAANGAAPWTSEWTWPTVNACVSADFNEDGFDDLIYSGMPRNDNGEYNGGDLYLLLGAEGGLKGGLEAIQLPRSNTLTDNIGTNFMVAADFNGDNHQDLLFIEHSWVTDSGDSTHYYSQGQFRLFLGDGKGNLTEDAEAIIDPYAGKRHGEGNLFAVDVNGDGWVDLVSSGYAHLVENTWNSLNQETTSVFLNKQGTLAYVPSNELAFVEPYQFSGEEHIKQWAQNGVEKMFPVDIGNDGLVDFVGFVQTPLHQWPQVEQRYTYAYVSKAVAPLGRVGGDENLSGTLGDDKIYAYDGHDTINGKNGNDILNGGEGLDTAVYNGLHHQYEIQALTGVLIDLQENRDGSDTLVNVERLHFSDTNVALDIGKGEVAGEAYRIYKAAFDRAPDSGGLGFWIEALDNGASLTGVANGFIGSPEFQNLYGSNVSNRDFVTKLYNNVLDRNPDQGGYDFWLGALANGASKADVLASFSESNENIANVADLIASGIQYQEWLG